MIAEIKARLVEMSGSVPSGVILMWGGSADTIPRVGFRRHERDAGLARSVRGGKRLKTTRKARRAGRNRQRRNAAPDGQDGDQFADAALGHGGKSEPESASRTPPSISDRGGRDGDRHPGDDADAIHQRRRHGAPALCASLSKTLGHEDVDAWNAVDFSPSDTPSGSGSLMPAVEGLVSTQPGRAAGKLTELLRKSRTPSRTYPRWRAWLTSCAGGSPGFKTGSVRFGASIRGSRASGKQERRTMRVPPWRTPLPPPSARCVPAHLTGTRVAVRGRRAGASVRPLRIFPRLCADGVRSARSTAFFRFCELEQARRRAAALGNAGAGQVRHPKPRASRRGEWLTPGIANHGGG